MAVIPVRIGEEVLLIVGVLLRVRDDVVEHDGELFAELLEELYGHR